MRLALATFRRLPAPKEWQLIRIGTAVAVFSLIVGSGGFSSLASDVAISEQLESRTAPVTFEADIQPLLTRHGCNSGACHGKARGQNGFALSLLGFDSDFDYTALVQSAHGRRISVSVPRQSALLRKATGQVPHGGGKRFDIDSPHYDLLLQWIQAGTPRTPADRPKLTGVTVTPQRQTLKPGETFLVRAIAAYSDGSQRDISDMAAFQSGDLAVARVSPEVQGEVQAGTLPGETTVMARYMGQIAVCSVTIPLAEPVPDDAYATLPRTNEIDDLVWKKLQLLGMLPSEAASEATFHRRAYVRAIGRLPTPQETCEFLADTRPGKRERLVDHLLERPEYADFWANKWADLLRPNPFRTGMKTVWVLHSWLRNAFREDMPYDQFVRELLTAKGSSYRQGAMIIFRDRPDTVEIGASVSQIFLGVRLECAKCHHHPFEVWGQEDFFGFAAFFSRVGRTEGLSQPISGQEEILFVRREGKLLHDRTGENVEPQVLKGVPLQLAPGVDPRETLVDWMTEPTNPYFAKVMANRVWAELMGRGLIDPIDDIRATNPASNEPLLDFLADDFRRQGYSIKKLIRKIMTSHVFGLSSTPTARNANDYRNFSRYYRQRMRAEVLLDAVNDILNTEEEFAAMAPGSRAMQVWTHRAPSIFLDTFGRPEMNQDPPCERTADTTTPQILHLMNSPQIDQKLSLENARPAQLAQSDLPNAQIVDKVYLLVYNRLPTLDESQDALTYFPADPTDRRAAVENLFWALLSTPEFFFVD